MTAGPVPPQPGQPGGPPPFPSRPGQPGWPGPQPPTRPSPALEPPRIWPIPGEWPGRLYERLLDQRIVLAHGWLDGDAATRLSAQLLTLDADSARPIRLELQNLEAELAAALSVMGVLDTLRAPVSAHVSGRISGPAVGVLAAATHRHAYPSALVVLSEPRLGFEGTVRAVTAQQGQVQHMLDELYQRLAAVTGRTAAQIHADAAAQTVLTVRQAVSYGLLDGPAERPGHEPDQP